MTSSNQVLNTENLLSVNNFMKALGIRLAAEPATSFSPQNLAAQPNVPMPSNDVAESL